MPTQPIRIFVTSQEQVDMVWHMFSQQTAIEMAEVWQDGSFQFLMVRHGDGPSKAGRGCFQGSAPSPNSPAAS